jgi:glycosyltransferase involved in cell wall biosynthesis
MRITIVSETYLPQVNGVSRTLSQLVRSLERAGDSVQVVHPHYGLSRERETDVLVRSEEIPFYRELRLPMPPFSPVHDAVERFQPQLIHIATEATLGLSLLRFGLKQRVPLVSSFHTNFDEYAKHYGLAWMNGAVWRYLRWFHNQTRETYVPSHTTIASLRARGFERLFCWPRGVDCGFFSPLRPGRETLRARLGFEPQHVVVGHVSRIAAEKNIEYLASALETLLLQANDRVRILIVGDGPARVDLEQRLGPLARCVGYKTGDELANHYAACDLFAFASLTETFGNVILEAMASGLPVVAVAAGGPAETIHDGETGLLIKSDEPPQAMAVALASLIADDTRRATMSATARRYAEIQSWESIMSKLRARYENLLYAPA